MWWWLLDNASRSTRGGKVVVDATHLLLSDLTVGLNECDARHESLSIEEKYKSSLNSEEQEETPPAAHVKTPLNLGSGRC